ncbi:MAG: hypothetical protein HC868_06050 [Sphingomonadales bacterium]|nr:hypothetical protein [Sphingomonadales bacterium]
MREMLALVTCAVLLGLGVAPYASAQVRNDGVRTGANAAAQARAARSIRSDLNRRQIEMSRMQRLDANQAIRDRAASGIGGSTYARPCSYEYRRWRQTGSANWRRRYNACAN